MTFSHVQPAEPATVSEFGGEEGAAPVPPQFTSSPLIHSEQEADVFPPPRPQRSRQRRR